MQELIPIQELVRGSPMGPARRAGSDEDPRTAFFRDILDHLYDGVYFVDETRTITYWNRGAERITGYPAEAVVGLRCADGVLMHVDEEGRRLCGRRCPLLRTMHNGSTHQAAIYLHHADGHRIPVLVRAAPMYDADGKIIGAVETFSDNSALVDALKKIHDLDDVACRDPLTSVGNRRFADLKIESSLAEFRGHGMHHGLLFVDIDRFKTVNDAHGHAAGDKVLVAVGRTMQSNLRTTDFVARWGGEEFLAIVFNVDENRLAALAENLRMLVASSLITVDEVDIQVTVSIGATLMRVGDDRASLVARADALMYRSKQEGRDRVTVGL